MGKLRQLALFHRYDLLFWCFAITLIPKLSFASDDFYKDRWRIESAVQKTYENGTKTVEIRARKGITVNGAYREYAGRANIVPYSQNVGKTMFRRIFTSRGNLALLGVIAVSAALKSDGFIIDEVDGKIYYPKQTSDTQYSLDTINWFNSPYDACNFAYGSRPDESTYKTSPPQTFLCYRYEDYLSSIYKDKRLGTLPTKLEDGSLDHADYIYGSYVGGISDRVQWYVFTSQTKESNPQPNREVSEKDLGDYMMGNLPNFQRPTWVGVTDVFTPVDDYELTNNPNYDVADKNIKEDSIDTSIKPIPDNSGDSSGNNGFSLPSFCDWATPVCSFIDWFKDDSTIPDDPTYKVDELDKSTLPDGPQFSLNASCPPPASFSLDLGLVSKTIDIPYTSLCNFSTDARPFVILAAWFHAAFIFAGLFRS